MLLRKMFSFKEQNKQNSLPIKPNICQGSKVIEDEGTKTSLANYLLVTLLKEVKAITIIITD